MKRERVIGACWLLALTLVLGLGMLAFPTPSAARDVPFPTEHTVDANFDGALDVYAADIDGDGDLDILGAAATANVIAWWENTAGDGSAWTEHTVTFSFDGVRSVQAADMDGDGDLDVLGAADTLNTIAWYENQRGDGSAWLQRGVDWSFGGAFDAHAADLDGDGDLDVLGAAFEDDDIAWWENTGSCTGPSGSCTNWTERTVENDLDGAHSVYAADVDGDGDLDVLGAAYNDDDITWFENTAGDGSAWTEHSVDAAFDGARGVHAADIDGDGDQDVLGAAWNADDITWWINTAGDGSAWTEYIVTGSFNGAFDIEAADVDGDGDLDILGAANLDDEIAWWENSLGDGSSWTERTVDASFTGADSVHAADVDGDGDLDVLGAAIIADDITWWENESIHRSAHYPAESKHSLDTSFKWAYYVYAADLDGDGDQDVLGAAASDDDIAWWENASGDGSAWIEHAVDSYFDGASSVDAADMDGDGDLDILGAAQTAKDITWWENTGPCTGPGGSCSNWTEHTVDRQFEGAADVHAADLDGDGDLDVLATGIGYGVIAWWENTGPCTGGNGDCYNWIEHPVSNLGVERIHPADMDGDNDLDFLSSSLSSGDAQWWENTAGDGSAWSLHTMDSDLDGAHSAYAADMDGDGDLDMLSAASSSGAIAWWENNGPCTGGAGRMCSTWTMHTVDDAFDSAEDVYAADLDGDGDPDVLGAGFGTDILAWWENTSGDGTAWTQHILAESFVWARSVYAADLDGDGDLDALGAAMIEEEIAWWENQGGQFALATSDSAPASINPGTQNDVLAIEVTHRGRSGDGDLELASLELLFEGCFGNGCTPGMLTSDQVRELFDRVLIYKDDGNGRYGGIRDLDILVTTVAHLALSKGVLTVPFDDGDTLVQLAPGTSQTYFVVLDRVDSAPHSPTVDRWTVTHLTEASSSAEDRAHDIGLSMEHTANVTSSVIFDSDTLVCEPVSNVWIQRVPAGEVFTGNAVQFIAHASGSAPRTYDWWVDGPGYGDQVFVHTFQQAIQYTVRVTVRNGCGNQEAIHVVNVQEAPPDAPDLSSSQKTANLSTVESGDILTYTLLLRNSSPVAAAATLTDPIPSHTTYVPGSARASISSTLVYTGGQLEWSGEVISGTPVLVEFAVAVQPAAVGTPISNTAYLDDGFGHTAVLEASSIYNPGYRLTVDDGRLYTNVPTVTLGYSWNTEDEISQVKFSNDGGFGPAGGTTEWLPVDAEDTVYEDWVLATYGDLLMPCSVHALFRDEGGLQYGPLRDDIIYDPAAPSVNDVEILEATGLSTMNAHGEQIVVRVTASDRNSGLAEVQLSHDPGFQPYSAYLVTGAVTDIPWDPLDADEVYVRVIDRAGNASTIVSAPSSVQYRVYLPMTVR